MRTINIFGRKMPILAILMGLLVIGTASAAVFLNYATLSGTVEVTNDISVDDIEIDGTGTLVFTDYLASFTINNDGDEPVIVYLDTSLYFNGDIVYGDVVNYDGLSVDYSVIDDYDGDDNVETGYVLVPPGGLTVDIEFDATGNTIPGTYEIMVFVSYTDEDYENFDGNNAIEYLELTAKTTGWVPTEDKVDVYFVPMGNDFYYKVLSEDVVEDTEYALIYYADFGGDRFGDWGGNNPGAVIAIETADSLGSISMSGSPNLDMNLPCVPDANIDEHDYSGAPDFYLNAHGAKLWLVPTSDLTEDITLPVLPLDGWNPEGIFFETDLIHYEDTNA